MTTPFLTSLAVNMVYEPFFHRASGDHHGFYIDFDTSSLFNHTIPIFRSTSRGFSSKDCKAVTTYLSEFNDHLKANNVFQRFNKLIKTGAPNHGLIETIDRVITWASVHAENQCCKHKASYWT